MRCPHVCDCGCNQQCRLAVNHAAKQHQYIQPRGTRRAHFGQASTEAPRPKPNPWLFVAAGAALILAATVNRARVRR
jgi:hypothetical protein